MSEQLLDGLRVMVTGGAKGIGAAVVARFSALGAHTVVLDLPSSTGDHIGVDVREEESVRAAVAEAVQRLGGLDAVVAAAGVVPIWQSPGEIDLDDFDRVLSVNARGVAATIKHAAAHLGDGGSITAIASLNSWRGDGNLTSYAASKHALLGIVRSAALGLGRNGIRVNAVAPGPIATAALRNRMEARSESTGLAVDDALVTASANTSLGRIATEAEVADTIVFLTSSMSSGITGQLINVDCGIY